MVQLTPTQQQDHRSVRDAVLAEQSLIAKLLPSKIKRIRCGGHPKGVASLAFISRMAHESLTAKATLSLVRDFTKTCTATITGAERPNKVAPEF
jgi:hypothetical protein